MSKLSRYLLRETVLPLLTMCGLTIVVGSTSQLLRMANDVAGVGISLGDLAKILPYALPSFFGMGLPVAYLLSMLVAFGRFAEDRELLALAASGISMRRLIVVPLVLAVVLMGIGLSMTTVLEPLAIQRLRASMLESATEYFGSTLDAGIIHDQLAGWTMYFKTRDKKTGELSGIFIADEREQGRPRLLTAETGNIRKEAGAALTFVLRNGELQEGELRSSDPARKALLRRVTFNRLDWRIDTAFFVGRTVSIIPMIAALNLDELYARSRDESLSERDRKNHTVWLHRKFVYPVANLIFVLLVFPVTTVLSRQSRLKAYLAAAMMVAVYFTMAQATDTLMTTLSVSSVVATWIPNILFALIGVVLTALRLAK